MHIEIPCQPGDDLWVVDSETMEVYCEKGGISAVVIDKDGIYVLDSVGERRDLHEQCGCLTKEEAEAFKNNM